MDGIESGQWNTFPIFRTEGEAKALLPEARAVVEEVIRQLPPGDFEISLGTLFVGRGIPEEVACFAASLVGIPLHLAPVEFELGQPFDETVETIVDSLIRWRQRVEAGDTP